MTRRLLASGIIALALLGAGCVSNTSKAEQNAELAIDIADDAKAKNSELENRIYDLESRLSEIDDLKSRIDDLESSDYSSEISQLKSSVEDAELNISTLQSEMSTAERKIRNLEYNQ